MFRLSAVIAVSVLCLGNAGCASHYVTPAGGVSMAEIADEDLRDYYQREPASPFPASIAMVRVQDAGYATRTAQGYGHGRYTIVTTRDVETDQAYESIVALPLVSGVAPIGRILLPPNASTIKDLRVPAAKLRADLLLVYSIDTTFSVAGKSWGPLSAISLGFAPNRKARVSATVAGILVDVRSGFIYGTTEATATGEQRATSWSSRLAIDTARVQAEQDAFADFVAGFGRLWKNVVDVHAATGMQPQPLLADGDRHFRVHFDQE